MIRNKKMFMMVGSVMVFMLFIGTRQGDLFLGAKGEEGVIKYVFNQFLMEGYGRKVNKIENSKYGIWMPEDIQKKGQLFTLCYAQNQIHVDEKDLENMEKENKQAIKEENWIVQEESALEEMTKEKEENQKLETVTAEEKGQKVTAKKNALVEQLKKKKTVNFLIDNFYIVDSTTCIDKSVFKVEEFLKRDFSIKKVDKPQILIFHTHAGTEYFADGTSKKDSIVATGTYLAQILEEKYGYQVIHDETKFDYINGKADRNKAYSQALTAITKVLEENPSIQVIIDLHRDGVNSNLRRVTEIDGKPTAQFMIFNGLSRNKNGNISYLYNPNLEANLAFGLQVKLKAMELYPDLTIRNYLKGYRYNMHLRERFLLIELGNENTTVEEARNTMPCLAKVLNEVLN
ncbi:MAG: stage II sporulation protein P [Lachnospiraceae bacterium]|nr:stage II sporulation protein P [Lachnospiraceae bacterium]